MVGDASVVGPKRRRKHKKVRLINSFFKFQHNLFELICLFFLNAKNKKRESKLRCLVYKRVNPFPNKPLFLRFYNTSLSKTLWEKKKLLVTSNFYFSHSVFYPLRKPIAIFIKLKFVVCKLFGRV